MISVKRDNPYRDGTLYEFGNEALLLESDFSYTAGIEDRYHRVQDHDTLPSLAQKYYGKQRRYAFRLWWVIAKANEIVDPFDITNLSGQDILIPDLAKLEVIR